MRFVYEAETEPEAPRPTRCYSFPTLRGRVGRTWNKSYYIWLWLPIELYAIALLLEPLCIVQANGSTDPI